MGTWQKGRGVALSTHPSSTEVK